MFIFLTAVLLSYGDDVIGGGWQRTKRGQTLPYDETEEDDALGDDQEGE